ncbi:MAG TPA: HPr family phosphocarrier protein [Desulfobacteraceae bacterium]|jgi:phosphocarrier protein HPr|nr:HPr family phosphocarrier protein [Desulfobacteraceae bacterium]
MEIERSFKVNNSLGLHARAAARIIELGKHFSARLYLRKEDTEVDGDGILSILSLACTKGTTVKARINGEDAEAFMEALENLFVNKFGEKL